MERIITAIKPTGLMHIGNYFGAVKPLLEMSNNFETLFFIADYHALNYIKSAEELRENSRKLAAAYLACAQLVLLRL